MTVVGLGSFFGILLLFFILTNPLGLRLLPVFVVFFLVV
jgi:hypothetical protein